MAGEDRSSVRCSERFCRRWKRSRTSFEFFEALRTAGVPVPRRAPLRQVAPRLADDPVRLGQEPSLAFAPSSLAAFDPGRRTSILRGCRSSSFGLFGPNGPLPLHLTEYARDRLRNAATRPSRASLDLFHHRMLSLFYRAWADAQPTVSFDRPATTGSRTASASLFGMGMASLRDRDACRTWPSSTTRAARLPDAQRRGPAGMLGELLRACRWRWSSSSASWLELPEEFRLRLGESPETGSLGRTTTIGARIWDCQQKFRLARRTAEAGRLRADAARRGEPLQTRRRRAQLRRRRVDLGRQAGALKRKKSRR